MATRRETMVGITSISTNAAPAVAVSAASQAAAIAAAQASADAAYRAAAAAAAARANAELQAALAAQEALRVEARRIQASVLPVTDQFSNLENVYNSITEIINTRPLDIGLHNQNARTKELIQASKNEETSRPQYSLDLAREALSYVPSLQNTISFMQTQMAEYNAAKADVETKLPLLQAARSKIGQVPMNDKLVASTSDQFVEVSKWAFEEYDKRNYPFALVHANNSLAILPKFIEGIDNYLDAVQQGHAIANAIENKVVSSINAEVTAITPQVISQAKSMFWQKVREEQERIRQEGIAQSRAQKVLMMKRIYAPFSVPQSMIDAIMRGASDQVLTDGVSGKPTVLHPMAVLR